MRHIPPSFYVLAAVFTATPVRAQTTAAAPFDASEVRRILQQSPLPPPPPDPTNRVSDNPAAIRLGRQLFFDKGLSANEQVSCASCHQPEHGWADPKPFSSAVGTTNRHAPTLWNVAYNRWYFWDGRADSLWSQAAGPLENPNEMDGDRVHFAHRLYHDWRARAVYEELFGTLPDVWDATRFPRHARPGTAAWDKMSEPDRQAATQVLVNIGKAIGAYERQLVSRHSPFDSFAEGLRRGDPVKLAAMPAAAQRGLRLFVGRGNCRLCHGGPNFSDGEFHNIRAPGRKGGLVPDQGRYRGIALLLENPFNMAGAFSDAPDVGRKKLMYLVANADTWGQFKTPSLRNVARRKPYMHQGQFATLREVLHFYSTLEGAQAVGHHDEQLLVPLHLNESEIDDLVAFLECLTDESSSADVEAPGGSTSSRY